MIKSTCSIVRIQMFCIVWGCYKRVTLVSTLRRINACLDNFLLIRIDCSGNETVSLPIPNYMYELKSIMKYPNKVSSGYMKKGQASIWLLHF